MRRDAARDDYYLEMKRAPTRSNSSVDCPLTPRERELLAQVARGCSNRKIGDQFGISEQTVKNHLANILHRFQVPDRTAAVVLALRRGWLDLASLVVVRREGPIRPTQAA
ncbi:MAG TPA: LuxR C-terminal-related transcriptional regulator [Chloroflexota bacterium]|nr:LuxR C-terminal-related transcriptional regulator [Chloroflexota bacterium]